MDLLTAIVPGMLDVVFGGYWKTRVRQKERDKEVFEKLIQILSIDGGLKHLQDRDLGNRPYSVDRISDLFEFVEIVCRVDHIFIDQDLEKKKRKLANEIENLLLALQRETFSFSDNPSHKRLPSRDTFPDPKDWELLSNLFNNSVKHINSLYQEWYMLARKKL